MVEQYVNKVSSDFMKLISVADSNKENLIDYAATDFLSIRTALVDYIKASYPLDYHNFIESDLGLMIMELVSYMGSVLSLKADMLANENFLSTARNRNNVEKLLHLIGITMKGPLASAANATLTLDAAATSPEFLITPANRVQVIASPEDGGPLNFTLYKVSGGKLVDLGSGGNLTLNVSESDPDGLGATTSSVWSNLALLEGALSVQTGTFADVDDRRIPLIEAPIIEGSVQVLVDAPGSAGASGVYTQVTNVYMASGNDDRIFQVAYTDDLAAVVIFGDDSTGVMPPVGSTYTVLYRAGGGSRGNIAPSVINTKVSTDTVGDGVVENTSLATGGSDAETITHAKRYGPLFFKRQDRIVTLEDYEGFVNSFIGPAGSVGKGKAVTRKAYSSANIIDIYLLGKASNLQLQRATVPFKSALLAAIEEKKMLTTQVNVADGLIRTLDLVVTVKYDRNLTLKEEEIKAKVAAVILNKFAVDNREFGQGLSTGQFMKDLFSVDEVLFVSLDNVPQDIYVEFNEIIQLNNFVINMVQI